MKMGRQLREASPSATPYSGSAELLRDELERIDHLVRARTVLWKSTLAADKPERLWGMIQVSDAEVDRYLSSPFLPPGELPPALEEALRPHWDAAAMLAEEIAVRLEVTPEETPLRLVHLAHCCGLSPAERDVLLICLLPELDERYRRLFAYLQDDASRSRPSVELVLQILRPVLASPPLPAGGRAMGEGGQGGEDLPAAGRALFAPGAPLLRHHLVTLDSEAEPLPVRPVRLDDRIASYLTDGDAPDPRLCRPEPLLSDSGDHPRADLLACEERQREQLQALAEAWRSQEDDDWSVAVLLHGPYGTGRLAAARAVCRALERPLLVADIGRALRAEASLAWNEIVARVVREARLRGAALCWTGCEALFTSEAPALRRDRLLEAAAGLPGVTFLASDVPWDPAGRPLPLPFLRFDLPAPGFRLRRELWQALLPPDEAFAEPAPDRSSLADALANGFQLTAGQITDAVAAAPGLALRRSPGDPRLVAGDLFEACRRQSTRSLQTFARRIEPRPDATFDDLILPSLHRVQLQELRQRIRHRGQVLSGLGFDKRLSLGRGLIALFTGSSGTGKTMAAELLARDQGVDLYKVDLSSVVSKYVGETEKNLSRVFAEAEDANAILVFDEADALFGKRGEVKEARDRWANFEVNYLLQRVEEYSGVVILTTNLRQNLDEAFLRRIQAIVEFPFPDAEARLAIWRGIFPPTVERPPDEELRVLAERFRLAGGSIKNIAVDAAFRAVADGSVPPVRITLRHLVVSVAREIQKAGRPLTKTEFGDELYPWAQELLPTGEPTASRP